MEIQFAVNGSTHTVSVTELSTLLEALRDLGFFGVREACGIGLCGACTVEVGGTPVSSCIRFAWTVDGEQLTTIEGYGSGTELHPVQQAYVDHNAFQCSYCTPGFVLMSAALLREQTAPTEDDVRDYLAGNLCRCGSYVKIIEAVLDAAGRLSPAGTPAVEPES